MMKKYLQALLLLLLTSSLISCGTYNYYTPQMNTPVFSGKEEFQLSGGVGANGAAFKTAYSLSSQLAVTGMYHTGFGDPYHSSEGEFALGYFFNKQNRPYLAFFGGLGVGRNYRQEEGSSTRDFGGDFLRPFTQITFSSGNQAIPFLGSIKGSGGFSFRVNYISYDGYRNTGDQTQDFNVENVYYEPYMHSTIGGEKVKLEVGIGIPFKHEYSPDENLKVFPLSHYVGLSIVF